MLVRASMRSYTSTSTSWYPTTSTNTTSWYPTSTSTSRIVSQWVSSTPTTETCLQAPLSGGIQALTSLDWPIWVVAIIIMPLLSVVASIELSSDDDKAYRRYLQFLRLEFDTRLGMHSPR